MPQWSQTSCLPFTCSNLLSVPLLCQLEYLLETPACRALHAPRLDSGGRHNAVPARTRKFSCSGVTARVRGLWASERPKPKSYLIFRVQRLMQTPYSLTNDHLWEDRSYLQVPLLARARALAVRTVCRPEDLSIHDRHPRLPMWSVNLVLVVSAALSAKERWGVGM